MQLNQNGKSFSSIFYLHQCNMTDILDGIKSDLPDHHAKIVCNNERPRFLKPCKVVMLNRQVYLLLTIVYRISCCYVSSEGYCHQLLILVFILMSLLIVDVKEENKTTHCDIIILIIYLFKNRSFFLIEKTSFCAAIIINVSKLRFRSIKNRFLLFTLTINSTKYMF
jgi:hypothetical protein